MTITGGTALPKENIDEMVRKAEEHAEEDHRRREAAEVRNNADTLVYQTEKLLSEQAEQVGADDKASIESALSELKESLAGDDVAAIKQKHEALVGASQEFAQRLYQSAAQQQAAAGGAPGGEGGGAAPDDEEVADAEIVDDDESA